MSFIEVPFHLDGTLSETDVASLCERFDADGLIVGESGGAFSASVETEEGVYDPVAVALAGAIRELPGVSIRSHQIVTEEEIDAHARFSTLLESVDDLTSLAERAGLSRRALEYKRKSERRVTQWDVWALERAVALGAGARVTAA